METKFKFELSQRVELDESREEGTVIARAEYSNKCNQYLVRYLAGDGRQTESWWDEDAITVAA